MSKGKFIKAYLGHLLSIVCVCSLLAAFAMLSIKFLGPDNVIEKESEKLLENEMSNEFEIVKLAIDAKNEK
jgi:hypothetical protein